MTGDPTLHSRINLASPIGRTFSVLDAPDALAGIFFLRPSFDLSLQSFFNCGTKHQSLTVIAPCTSYLLFWDLDHDERCLAVLFNFPFTLRKLVSLDICAGFEHTLSPPGNNTAFIWKYC